MITTNALTLLEYTTKSYFKSIDNLNVTPFFISILSRFYNELLQFWLEKLLEHISYFILITAFLTYYLTEDKQSLTKMQTCKSIALAFR